MLIYSSEIPKKFHKGRKRNAIAKRYALQANTINKFKIYFKKVGLFFLKMKNISLTKEK